jgi:hypothetical protein
MLKTAADLQGTPISVFDGFNRPGAKVAGVIQNCWRS